VINPGCTCRAEARYSVPILIFVAFLVLFYGQDHPAGDWSQRHMLRAGRLSEEKLKIDLTDLEKSEQIGSSEFQSQINLRDIDPVDIAINEELTVPGAIQLCLRPVTWLPGLAYLTTFGLELAIDGQMATILFGLFNKRVPGFAQTKAGYYTSILQVLCLHWGLALAN
jgi:MFS transporter, NNP family, nitrate/nitrite transporter